MNATAMRFGMALCVLLLLYLEPALANKFETNGGAVSGSSGIKREWLQKFLFVGGGLSLLGSILAAVLPHRNAAYLNYGNWKQSAIVLLVFAVVFFLAAVML
ncbi:MAG: hypothetical protein WBM81_07545 [Sedimenticolaceae bacterium]